jgi:hypothetical protein
MRIFPRYLEQAPHSGIRLVLALLLALPALHPVWAVDETDPFQLDTSHWMSFDRYKDVTQHQAATSAKADDDQTDLTKPAPEPEAVAAAPTPETAASARPTLAAIAAPQRPLNPPLMPGMNKGFSVPVTSTEDDRRPLIAPVAATAPVAPGDMLRDMDWQDAADAARRQAMTAAANDRDEDSPKPLDVRYSALPNTDIAPLEPTLAKHNHGRPAPGAKPQVAEKEKPAAKSATDLAACAAIDAYKKRQLEAIQGDRQTLQALQEAIIQLGLQKELGFMTGSNSTLNLPQDRPVQ